MLASTYQWDVGRAEGQRQSWGRFPGWGRGWHMSQGLCECQGRGLLWTLPQQGWALGVLLHLFCVPRDFHMPRKGGHRARQILPHLLGSTGCQPSPHHPPKPPGEMQAGGRINHSGSLQLKEGAVGLITQQIMALGNYKHTKGSSN